MKFFFEIGSNVPIRFLKRSVKYIRNWFGVGSLDFSAARDPFHKHGSILFPAWNHILSKVWDEITYPFPNFDGSTVEFGDWISNLTPIL